MIIIFVNNEWEIRNWGISEYYGGKKQSKLFKTRLLVSVVADGRQPTDGLTIMHAEETDNPQQHNGLTARLLKFNFFNFFHFYPLLVPHLIPSHLLMKEKHKTEKEHNIKNIRNHGLPPTQHYI